MAYDPVKCWGDAETVKAGRTSETWNCPNVGQTALGLCAKCHAEIVSPTVRFSPCLEFRSPLEGDLLTCRDCGWFAADHDEEDR